MINNFNKNEKDINQALKHFERLIFYIVKSGLKNHEFNESLNILYNYLKSEYTATKQFNEMIPFFENEIQIHIDDMKKRFNIADTPLDIEKGG